MKAIFTCLLLGVLVVGFGQQNTFKVRLYNEDEAYPSQIVQLSDGSFITVGDASNSNGDDDITLVKQDAQGVVLASKFIDLGDDAGLSVTKTTDGGFAITGYADDQLMLLKFANDLTLQWQKHYTITKSAAAGFKLVQSAADGGYMIVGTVFNNNSGNSAGYLLKTDAQGNVLLSKQYFNYDDYNLIDIASTSDGNYVVLGASNYLSYNQDTSFLMKIKPDGSILWSNATYNDTAYLESYSLMVSSDGSIIVSGDAYSHSIFDGNSETTVFKYNNTGSLLWSKKFPVTANGVLNFGASVIEDNDGGYIVGGGIDLSDSTYTSDDYVVKTDTSGALKWTKSFEPTGDYGYGLNSITKTVDGGFAACSAGYLAINGSDKQDVVLFYKFNSNFETCNELIKPNGTIVNIDLISKIDVVPTKDLTATASNISVTISDAGTIDNICSSNALPLQLLTFNASLQNKSVAVQWTTANEVNTNYFIVERSKNAASFTALQQVTAKGNSAGVQSYNTTDLQPLAGTSYYRLKEVDKDGKVTYSSVVPVTVLSNGVVVISPNPVRDAIKLVMQSAGNSSITVQVVDMNGRIMATQKASVTTGRNEILIPAASLAKGIYILKVIEKNAVQTIRFVKE